MPILSNAVDQTAVARVTGYGLGFKDFSPVSSNLPQRIAIFTTVGADKDSGFTDYDVPIPVNSVKDVISTVGVSEAYYIARMLKPLAGGGVGTVPVDMFVIEDDVAAVAASGDITPSGTATTNATHYVTFNGRKDYDGRTAGFTVETSDTVTEIIPKIIAAVQGMLYAPVTASDGTTTVDLTARWKGITGNEITVSIDTGTEDAGISYAFTQPASGAGAIDISGALANFGDVWYTQVLNTYGTARFDDLSNFNGAPDPDTGGTGRWSAIVVKPFVAFTGSVESTVATLKALAASRKTDITNALVVAPNSPGMTWEVAAAGIVNTASIFNSSPHSSVNSRSLFGIPSPTGGTIGDMSDYLVRDDLVKNGISTVSYTASEGYKIEDMITFRRPDDQSPTAIDWRYVRDIVGVDFNVLYQYRLLEETILIDKTLVEDDAVIAVANTIKPKDWKGAVYALFDSLEKLALIADASFSKSSLQAQISPTNPQRFETTFNYKRTGIARISSTTAYAGFNFGEL